MPKSSTRHTITNMYEWTPAIDGYCIEMSKLGIERVFIHLPNGLIAPINLFEPHYNEKKEIVYWSLTRYGKTYTILNT